MMLFARAQPWWKCYAGAALSRRGDLARRPGSPLVRTEFPISLTQGPASVDLSPNRPEKLQSQPTSAPQSCFTDQKPSPKPTLYMRTVTVALDVRSIVSPLRPDANETARTSCVARRPRWSAIGPRTPTRLNVGWPRTTTSITSQASPTQPEQGAGRRCLGALHRGPRGREDDKNLRGGSELLKPVVMFTHPPLPFQY